MIVTAGLNLIVDMKNEYLIKPNSWIMEALYMRNLSILLVVEKIAGGLWTPVSKKSNDWML